jgi:PAS domain S-box-containing protein
VNERHHAEQAVRSSEQQYRALAEHVADGIVILREGSAVFVNDALCSMLKYPADRLLRIAPVDLFREQDREPFFTWFQQIRQGNTLPNLQAVCRTGDDQEIWTEGRSSVIDWEGEPAILVTVRDITERKLHEFEIEKRREHLQKENIALRSTMRERYKFGEIVGKSPAMQEVYELIAHASTTDANVVIYGESGTGKELTAHTIHQLSARRTHPFAPVNCGAIPENLFESEFFGHRKGAFTGADRDNQGFFARAHKGTLFLDEVGELSPTMQVKLLRALQSGEYIPVGENAPRNADARIIAATNKDLTEQLRKGGIRKDFFYRINVVTIVLPPLRERREDIPLLIDHFLEHDNAGKAHLTLPGNILSSLFRYDWPGNVRELQNVLQRYLTIGRLDFSNAGIADVTMEEAMPGMEIGSQDQSLQEALDSLEKQLLIKTLEQHHWHRGKTAASLGIPRRSLQRKMNKYGLM